MITINSAKSKQKEISTYTKENRSEENYWRKREAAVFRPLVGLIESYSQPQTQALVDLLKN
jgi:hypothetical protein